MCIMSCRMSIFSSLKKKGRLKYNENSAISSRSVMCKYGYKSSPEISSRTNHTVIIQLNMFLNLATDKP